MNKVFIRTYNKEDKPDLLALLVMNTPHFFAAEEELDFSYYLDYETELYYVLEVDDVIAGCGGINFSDNRTTAKISWDILHPGYQRMGLGKMLLRYRLSVLEEFNEVTDIIVRTS